MTSARWANGILGLWLGLSAFLGFTAFSNAVNLLSVGTIVAGIGFAMREEAPGQGWATALAGSWLVVAAFIPPLQIGSALVWNSVIVAAAIVVASIPFVGTGEHPEREAPRRARPSPLLRVETPPTAPSTGWSPDEAKPREEAQEEEREFVHH